MFGVSFPELIVIFTVGLIVFGPDKLPELAAKLGRLSAELRKHSDSIRREFYNSVYKPVENLQSEANKNLTSLKSELLSTQNPHSKSSDFREPNCETALDNQPPADQKKDEPATTEKSGTPS